MDGVPIPTSAEMERVALPPEATKTSPRLRDSIRRDDPDEPPTSTPEPPSPSASGKNPKWQPEAPTAPSRAKGTPRPPLAVDQVGTAAVKLAQSRRGEAPRLVASRSTIAQAPIDARAAFILSLVDGVTTVDALVDMSGMPGDEVRTILGRLTRLGLIAGS
jgi:hypothetical protein